VSTAAEVLAFNNGFKVAEDIRQLGAVPEDPESDEDKDVVLDKHMAIAMEERLLRGVEEELFREKRQMVKSLLKGESTTFGGADGCGARQGARIVRLAAAAYSGCAAGRAVPCDPHSALCCACARGCHAAHHPKSPSCHPGSNPSPSTPQATAAWAAWAA